MLLSVILAAALGSEQKTQVTGPVNMSRVTPCVRRLQIQRDTIGGFSATAYGPDAFPVHVELPYRYAQVWTYTHARKRYVSLDFARVWGTEPETSLGVSCEKGRAFFFVLNYPEPGINTPMPFWPGSP